VSATDPSEEIRVESLYGARSDAPLVKLIVGTHEVIMAPEKARALGAWLQEAAEAAYGDAFLVRFMMQAVGLERARAVPLLREFRAFRELSRRQGREHEEADQGEWEERHERD
jgi:hypothetical protein